MVETVSAEPKKEEASDEELLKLFGEKEEGELCLVATVVGCREFKDRIEFAMYLKDYVNKQRNPEKEDTPAAKKPAQDFKLVISDRVCEFVEKASMELSLIHI